MVYYFIPHFMHGRGGGYFPHSQLKRLQLREVKTRAQQCSAHFLVQPAQDRGN